MHYQNVLEYIDLIPVRLLFISQYIYIYNLKRPITQKPEVWDKKIILQAYGFSYAVYTIEYRIKRLKQPKGSYHIFWYFGHISLYIYMLIFNAKVDLLPINIFWWNFQHFLVTHKGKNPRLTEVDQRKKSFFETP